VFCSKCGAALTADTAFCQSCGNPVSRTAVAAVGAVGAPPLAVSPHAGVGAIVYATNVSYAGFWLRVVAHLVDSFIIGFAMLCVMVPLFFLMGGVGLFATLSHQGDHPDPGEAVAFATLICALVAVAILGQWLYFAYLESGQKQATWGKQIFGLYVTDLAGNRITFGRASGRFFAKIISGLIPFFLGYIMAAFTERRQALHDMIASCLVLRR
jgi:uncharacterized RDD family membrane protein YckC